MRCLFVFIAFALITTIVRGQTGTVVINVEGVDLKKGGILSAGVFNEPNFPNVGKQVMVLEVTVTSVKMQLTLTDVPSGTTVLPYCRMWT